VRGLVPRIYDFGGAASGKILTLRRDFVDFEDAVGFRVDLFQADAVAPQARQMLEPRARALLVELDAVMDCVRQNQTAAS
jgi:hypothetical protein